MPDLFLVLSKRWKFIVGLPIAAALIALAFALLSPKKYLSTATALPANSLASDKAHIFNPNVEILYSDFGAPDELDRMEGTGTLDTIYIATVNELSLAPHYGFDNGGDGPQRAAVELKKNSSITRSGYGELKVKVWDGDRNLAAAMANSLLARIQLMHQHLQQQGSALALQQLVSADSTGRVAYKVLVDSSARLSGADAELAQARKAALLEQLQQYEKLMDQYRLALGASPQSLLTVEHARPGLWPDKPKVVPTVLFTLGGAFIFALLAALFIESRKQNL